MADGKWVPRGTWYPTSSQILEKPLISPSPFDVKSSGDDYQVQFKLIAFTSVMAMFLAASLTGPTQAVLNNLDEDPARDYYAPKGALSLRFRLGEEQRQLMENL